MLDCPEKGYFRGNDGICYACDEVNTVLSDSVLCSESCPNRTASGYDNGYCSLPCADGEFTGQRGECHSCTEDKNISTYAVYHDGCERCPDTRNQYNSYCVPKCPADAPLRGWDNKCYPCDTTERVNVINMTDACMECYEERALDGNYCVLKE